MTTDGTKPARIEVGENGEMRHRTGSSSGLNLDGITFLAEE